MLQPYMTPGAGHPQQAYMMTPNGNVQQTTLYPVPQPYQQPQRNPYLTVSPQHLQPMHRTTPSMLGPSGAIAGGLAASNQHLHTYGMQQIATPNVQQKPLYTGSWTNGPSVAQSPPRPGHSPITSYPTQGMHNSAWNVLPQNIPLPPSNNALHSSFTSGVTQSYSPTSAEKASSASQLQSTDPYLASQTHSYQSAQNDLQTSGQGQSSLPYHSSPTQPLYQSAKNMSNNSSQGPSSNHFLSSQTQFTYQSAQNESKNDSQAQSSNPFLSSQTLSSYQGQNFSYDIKSSYTRQVSESGSAASSRSSSPQRSRASSIHSLHSLAQIEAKEERCTSSPPIAPHPFATKKSNVPDKLVIQEEIPKEETPPPTMSTESIEEQIFHSRASSHGIQISAPGTFDPSSIKKKSPKKVYREKVKADRFMEIAMKRGIVVTMATTQKDSEDSSSISEQNCLGDEDSNVNSVSEDSDGKLTGTGAEAESSDNLYSDSCSQSDGEGYLSDFSSHFAKIIIEDVCAELTQELNSGYNSEQSSSKLNAEAKEFTMSWSTEEPVALNPESPEFKPSFFRHHEASQSTDEDSDVSSTLFQRNCNSGVDIYIADQPEIIENEAEEEESLQPESLMVDVAVNTKRIKHKDANVQTPLAFEPRDVCVNTDETCMSEGSEFYAPELQLKSQGTNTSPVETRSRQVQAKIGVKTHSQGVQVGSADSFQVKPCKHCPEKDMQIIKLQMQVCHLRAQMCISELQRQMTELQQSKLQINSFFTQHMEDDDLQVSYLIDARIEWLHDEITQIKFVLMTCIEELQKGKPLEDLPLFGINISTLVGNTRMIPKELRFLSHPETEAGESPRSRKRTHEKNLVSGESLSPSKSGIMDSERVATRTLVEESLLELQRERKSQSVKKTKVDGDCMSASTVLQTDQNNERSLAESDLSMNNEAIKENQTYDVSSGLEKIDLNDPVVQSLRDSLCKADNALVSAGQQGLSSSSESSSSRNAKHRKDNQTGSFACNFDEEFPALSNSTRPEVKLLTGTESNVDSVDQSAIGQCVGSVTLELTSSKSSSSEMLVQNMPLNEESPSSKPDPVQVAVFQQSELDPDKADTRESQLCSTDSSGQTDNAKDLQGQHTDLLVSSSDHTVNSPPNSLPKPIPTLPFPCPQRSIALDSTNVKTSFSCQTAALKEEESDTREYPSDNVDLVGSEDAQVTDTVTKDPEDLPAISPRKDADVRAPPGFEQSGNLLEDEINADIEDCDIDTDQLVKKARAVLENFNLTTGKNRVIVTSPSKASKVPTPHTASSLSPASAPGIKAENSPALEVLTTGRSVAGTGEIVQVVDNSISENDTGISQLILSNRRKLQESEALCEKDKESSTLASSSDSTASSSNRSQEDEVSVPLPAGDKSQGFEMSKPSSVQMSVCAGQSDVEQPPQAASEIKQPLSTSEPNPQQQQAGQINPNLYQAVFAQVAKAYPHLASNPMMLHSVCLQQTMVLQSYMKGAQGSGQLPAGHLGQTPAGLSGQPPTGLPCPHPTIGAGSGDGPHVQPTAFQTSETTPAYSQNEGPVPQPTSVPPGDPSKASWNPVALVNMMHARKGTVDENQQIGVSDAENPNPQSAFKFQAIAASGHPNHPPHAVAVSGRVNEKESVPSVLKDYVLKDKNKYAGDHVASSGLLETQQKHSPLKEINPFEPSDGVSRPGFTKVQSQKRRPATKSKPGTGRVSPVKNTENKLFPPVKATNVAMDEDWEDDCDSYPSEFTCKQDVKAPVYFRPIEPAEPAGDDPEIPPLPPFNSAQSDQRSTSSSFRGRRRNVSERGQSDRSGTSTCSNTPTEEYQTASAGTSRSRTSAFSRSLSNSSTDSRPDSRKSSYTGLDDFGGYGSKKEPKPVKPDTNFLGRLLKNTVTSNDKKMKEKEERLSNKTPDPEKKEEAPDDDWQTVSMKKRKRDQTRAEQLPSMAMVPATSKPSSKTSRNNFDKLVDHLEKTFPFLSRKEIKELISAIRYQRGGGLTGMKMDDIIAAAQLVVEQKFQFKLMTDDAYKKPVPLMSPTPGAVYCTPEFQKHYQEAKSVLPSRPTVRSPGASSSDEDVCPICFEDFSHKKMQRLDCGHEFHVECIRKWVLGHERTCPTCRRLTLFHEEFPRLK